MSVEQDLQLTRIDLAERNKQVIEIERENAELKRIIAELEAKLEPLSDEAIKRVSLNLRFQEIFMGYHSIIPAFARAIEKAHGISAPTTKEQ